MRSPWTHGVGVPSLPSFRAGGQLQNLSFPVRLPLFRVPFWGVWGFGAWCFGLKGALRGMVRDMHAALGVEGVVGFAHEGSGSERS